MKRNGLIAIDIDGTLTAKRDELSSEVVHFLHDTVKKGWQLLFVTGRTVDWSLKLLGELPFEFYLSSFNGAYTLTLPDKKVLKKYFLPFEHVFQVVNLVKDEDVGIAFYGEPGRTSKSFLYRKFASHVVVRHLLAREKAVGEKWKEVENVMDLPVDSFMSVRLFCLPHTAKKIAASVAGTLKLHAPMMKDSFDDGFSIVQVTHGEASKGGALDIVKSHLGKVSALIACGDDHNDISMLKMADRAVVMAQAPSEVLSLADIIAPPAKLNGIIQGITQAIASLEIK